MYAQPLVPTKIIQSVERLFLAVSVKAIPQDSLLSRVVSILPLLIVKALRGGLKFFASSPPTRYASA